MLIGCVHPATYWSRPGDTQQQQDASSYQCRMETRSAYLAAYGYSADNPELWIACMKAKGYSQVSAHNEAAAQTNSATNMACQTDLNCSYGSHCRSKKGGGTECR